MSIKGKHLAWTVAALVGAFYLFHMWATHGTFKQTLSGIGISR